MTNRFAEIAALAGEPGRAQMLHALLDGRALTANELAAVAGVSPPTASGHLSRTVKAGLLDVVAQGRHRYFRLSGPAVAEMMEAIMKVASAQPQAKASLTVGPKDRALRRARTCYDHLAGALGVALADALTAADHVELTEEAEILTEAGLDFLARIGLDVAPLQARQTRGSGRILCRPCLDWSERRPHLAGALGAALCSHSLEAGWVRRLSGTRALEVTRAGERAFKESFGLRL
ncbi:ArsR/SmtB family transcription factor [Afifella pfennigii]|uniref:ArsR/SmtB family transcription factor n=1 Tax=Afifella pfennigii TaxID=209897 RepID=UPI00047EA761|nr:helix-turn-helix transcriptional regulator [Afifella pfennigii]